MIPLSSYNSAILTLLNCTQFKERSQQFETIFQEAIPFQKISIEILATTPRDGQNTKALIEFETKSQPRMLSCLHIT
jgi:hypothetical protein